MSVYLVLFFLLIVLYFYARENRNAAFLLVFILCFLAFFRGIDVGTDTWGYARSFRLMSDSKYTWNREVPMDVGFNYFMLYFKKLISDNPLDCLGFVSVTYVLGFTCYARKYSKDFMATIILFILYGSYFLCYNIMRQCFALGLLLFSFCIYDIRKLDITKKTILASLIIVIAYLFHPSAAITLLMLTYKTRFSKIIMKKKVIISAIVISFALFCSKVVIQYVIDYLDMFGLSGKLYSYITTNAHMGKDSDYSLIKLLLISSFQIYTIICCKKTRNVFLYISSLAILFLNIFGVFSIELVRVYESLMCFGLVGFIEVLNRNRKRSILASFYPQVLMVYCIVLYFNIIIKGYGGIIPYSFR